jgi:hypothetical protein
VFDPVPYAAVAHVACCQSFPSEYDTAIRQAQLATRAALADGLQLLEVSWLARCRQAGNWCRRNRVTSSCCIEAVNTHTLLAAKLTRTLQVEFPVAGLTAAQG